MTPVAAMDAERRAEHVEISCRSTIRSRRAANASSPEKHHMLQQCSSTVSSTSITWMRSLLCAVQVAYEQCHAPAPRPPSTTHAPSAGSGTWEDGFSLGKVQRDVAAGVSGRVKHCANTTPGVITVQLAPTEAVPAISSTCNVYDMHSTAASCGTIMPLCTDPGAVTPPPQQNHFGKYNRRMHELNQNSLCLYKSCQLGMRCLYCV